MFGHPLQGTFMIEGCGGPMWATLNGTQWGNCGASSDSGPSRCNTTANYVCIGPQSS
ncbi:hypothetical protein B0H19DRAFT_1107608 [Mycena capillaripes]|nr:hypothetical protein B0H19DRAFT_1107608 [Mycena capillaripes]